MKGEAKLSYITTGQNVPEDIEEAAARKVAQLICSGCLERERLIGETPPEETIEQLQLQPEKEDV